MSRQLWATQLGQRFASAFPDSSRGWRTIGREAEFPVVRADGRAAEVSELWADLQKTGDFQVKREAGLIVQLDSDEISYAAEVGRGTIEVICSPSDDLHALKRKHERAVQGLVSVTDAHGFSVLGYGIQPVTAPTVPNMSPKQRYGVLHAALGDLWLWFTLTASDQVHIDISRDELVAQTNISNLLSGLTVAMCGNSPIYERADSGLCSAREGRMGLIHSEAHRHGMPGRAVRDVVDYVDQIIGQPFLMQKHDGHCSTFDGTFVDYLAQIGGADSDAAWAAFELHDHYIWNSGRPRNRQRTLELRAAAQQPGSSHMAAATLGLAMVEAGPELARFVEQQLGAQAWPTLARWHQSVIRDGLGADEPVDGFLSGLLERCTDALKARGRGEEVFMDDLWSRFKAKKNPAQEARAAFESGGLDALLKHTRIR